jgi:hypothetical protein
MRALEISIFLIMVLTAPTVIYSMGVGPTASTTCTTLDCQARVTLYNIASSFQLQEVSTDSSVAQMGWDLVMLTVTFPIYAFFWMLYFLSLIVLIKPALIAMFHIPDVLATYLNVGVVILWLIAYVQWKRGGLGTDASR